MEGNPYSKLLSLVREQAGTQIPTTFHFGTVIKESPLKIEVSNTIQTAADLLRNSGIGEFKVGDTILLVPIENNQRFIILCKVVNI